jgi:hypothetical protein
MFWQLLNLLCLGVFLTVLMEWNKVVKSADVRLGLPMCPNLLCVVSVGCNLHLKRNVIGRFSSSGLSMN